MLDNTTLDRLAKESVDSAFAVHVNLGPGLLESTYQACLEHELKKRGLSIMSQVGLPVIYDGQKLDIGYRIDSLIEGSLILEVKAVDGIAPVHKAQLLSYLKLSGCQLGLLFNFNVVRMVNGF